MGNQPQNGQTQVIQNVDNPQDQAAAQYVAAAVNHYQQEEKAMENGQAQAQQAAIPVQVSVGDQQQESWFNTSNAMKVGGGIVAGIAAKAMYDHFSSSGNNTAIVELSSAVSDLL